MTVRTIDDSPDIYLGLSTDEKPTGVMDGAEFIATDTGAYHRYDADTSSWFGPHTDVSIQDQTSPMLIVPMNKISNQTTLTSVTAVDDKVISVTAATGAADGAFVSLANIEENRYYTGTVVSSSSLDITVDCPIDFAFPVVGTIVSFGTDDLAVDGSSTTQVFSLRASDPGLPVVIDVTRLIFICIAPAVVDLTTFGSIVGGLTHGLCIRRVDGVTRNIVNFKTNADIAGTMFDWTPFAALNPVQGVDGFVARMTFAGQNKMGVAVRVGPGEDIQALVQDALQSQTSLRCIIEGHVVVS